MRIAIIGLGMASLPHLAALKNLSDKVTVTGVYCRDDVLREKVANEHGYHAFSSLDEIALCQQTQAVLLITPPSARYEIINKMSASGKHILSEKPLERSYSSALALVEMCEARGVKLGVVFQHRFRVAAMRLADIMKDGKLGDLALVRAEIPWWREQAYYDAGARGTYAQDGGGVLITQAIHVLELMLSITGPVKKVQALCATTKLHNMETEDFASCGLVFESGFPGSIVATTASYPGGAEKLIIDGTLGSATLEAGKLVINFRDGRTVEVGEETRTGCGANPMDFPCDWHQSVIEDFASSVSDNRDPKITGRTALGVHKLLEAIRRSSDSAAMVSLADIV